MGKGVMPRPFITRHMLNIIKNICESLASASHLYKWWSTLKIFLFSVNTSHPPIRTQDGSVTFDPSGMVEVFSMAFQGKQCDQVLNFSPICFPYHKLTYFAFNSSEIKNYWILMVVQIQSI